MIGQHIAQYRVTERLGAGAMGVVYRARDERLGRDVALKLLPMEALGDEAARRRLEHEARTASALNHPHICTIYDVGEAGGQLFLAMELVAGQPLDRCVATDGLPDASIVRIGMQLADALEHAHQHGIIHRDLKPANVVLTPEGRAKILDFGLPYAGVWSGTRIRRWPRLAKQGRWVEPFRTWRPRCCAAGRPMRGATCGR